MLNGGGGGSSSRAAATAIAIIDTELKCYVLNMQQIPQIIHVNIIQLSGEKWLCKSQKISANPYKT
jgi:hypothetical protein